MHRYRRGRAFGVELNQMVAGIVQIQRAVSPLRCLSLTPLVHRNCSDGTRLIGAKAAELLGVTEPEIFRIGKAPSIAL